MCIYVCKSADVLEHTSELEHTEVDRALADRQPCSNLLNREASRDVTVVLNGC